MQKPYEHYKVVDFVTDDAFLSHQLSPTEQSSLFWQTWLTQHPNKESEWHEATQLVEAVRLGLRDYARTYLSEEAENQLLDRIQTTNLASQTMLVVPFWQRRWLVSAAAACLIIAAGLWLYRGNPQPVSLYQQRLASLDKAVIEKINTTDQPQTTRLPDGSTIWLSPHSRLSYLKTFGQENRTVYLSGEATFDVTHNPQKPFLVYANELITKVLGTKFKVKSFEQDKDVVVVVLQGKVTVYRNEGQAQTDNRAEKGVLLLPNQQVMFTRATEHFSKSLVEMPAILSTEIGESLSFEFEEAPIDEVFKKIEKAYGVEIIFNEEVLKNCQLTASLSEESLFEKLDIITQSIGATYQLLDAQVIISSKGCQP